MKHLTTKLHRYRHFLYFLLAVVFIWWFKIAVDNYNKEAIRHNDEMKKNCPCEKWHYVTKGQWECDCPQNNMKYLTTNLKN